MRFVLLLLAPLAATHGQHSDRLQFTRADTLIGSLTPVRTCYDVRFYHLSIDVDTAARSIAGFNKIVFTVVEDFDRMQVDLHESLVIDSVMFEDEEKLTFQRVHRAVFIRIPRVLRKNAAHYLTVYYSGKPVEAKRPPWDGGFTWARDREGILWVSVTCQGEGASLWWPTKDHQSDEPDSMMISVSIPSGLMNVSNGRLRATDDLGDGRLRWNWFVSYPINNYNVTINIAKYARFTDYHLSGKDTLTLDYYVLPYNMEKARRQFEQVKPMLVCFEKHFGPYPFVRDGYKLVESPHLGMEHQSAVAYGNEYLQGYRGTASSEIGLAFDFIIIHETAHEWWGNSVTSNDVADMWIHESFGAYAEAVYVECLFGYDKAMSYVNGKKTAVLNDRPIIGPYGVRKSGSKDMYNKGQLVLNTLRHVINNDSLWWDILKSIATQFKRSSVDAEDILQLVNNKAGTDLSYFFEQYLKRTKPPRLETELKKKGPAVELRYRWVADMEEFRMPIRVWAGGGEWVFLHPTTVWQTTRLDRLDPAEFRIAEEQFYVESSRTVQYVDPAKAE